MTRLPWPALLASVLLAGGVAAPARARARAALTSAQTRAIDDSVREWLSRTGAPSMSIAVVQDGGIAYLQAYGAARV